MAVRTARRRRPFGKPPAPSRAFPRSSHQTDVARAIGRRALTAAAVPINMTDRQQLQKMRALRYGWQNEAWQYRHAVPEARFAVNFLANCTRRMRIFPAAYQANGEDDNPVALSEIEGIPPNVVLAARSALTALGNGRLALAGMMHKLSTSVSVPGECWLLGQENQFGGEDWKIRSTSEIIVKDDRYTLREVPQDSQSAIGWTDLDPDKTVLIRMWVPDPEYDILADSPMRTLGETCEGLQILRRGIRASGRSRLSGPGLIAMPNEIQLMRPNDDNDDPEADDVVGELMDAMATAIAEEGTASADIPIFLQGPGEFLDKITRISFDSGFDAEHLQALDYLQGVFAVGFDLPKIVVTGAVEEANHWSQWSVSADTFRHYIEPHVMTCVDMLTTGYFRQSLIADGVPMEWVDRLLVWYDPVELISAPDKSEAARQAYQDMVLSGKAYVREVGFTEADMPTIQELEMRRVMDIRALPLNLLMEYASRADPSLVVPAMTGPPQLPGIKPGGGVDVGQAPGAPAGTAPVTPGDAASPAAPAGAKEGPPPQPTNPDKLPSGITAAASAPPTPTSKDMRLSRKLTQIDKDLRARLRVAANVAMKQQLERAGKRVKNAARGYGVDRSTVIASEGEVRTVRGMLQGTPDWLATATLGQRRTEELGLTAQVLSKSEWAQLKAQWNSWTAQAQTAAITTAAQLAGADEDHVQQAQAQMDEGRDAGWAVLAAGMSELASKLLYNPDPDGLAETLASVNLDTLVPTGLIRTALGVAGGIGDSEALAMPSVGQIGTGSTVGNLLTIAGSVQHSFEWDHGAAQDDFEPHAALDGVDFDSFTSDVLRNTSDFPPVEYLLPGDHDGCTCDVTPLWMSSSEDD
jgi:hypothetical protein